MLTILRKWRCYKIFGHSLLYLGTAALAGLMMALQGTINSVLGKKIGIWEVNFIVHFTAVIILVLILFLNHKSLMLEKYLKLPWYLYLGGLMGVIITYGVVISIPKLGVAVATTAIITAQVLTAAVIDHFGILGLEEVPFTWYKFTGIILLSLGVRLLLH